MCCSSRRSRCRMDATMGRSRRSQAASRNTWTRHWQCSWSGIYRERGNISLNHLGNFGGHGFRRGRAFCQPGYLIFNRKFGRLGFFRNSSGRNRRRDGHFRRRHYHSNWWTRRSDRLWSDHARRRLRRLDGSNRSRACRRYSGLRRNGLCWHSSRRRYGLPQGRRRSRTGGRRWLDGPLRDRLQHITRFGDVREVKLGLEFFNHGRTRAATSGTGLTMLLVVLLDGLRFFYFDRTGVRLFFGYSNLGENVENYLALYLELSREVVDSNLCCLHSALRSSVLYRSPTTS